MGIAAVKIKIMPESPSTDMARLEKDTDAILKKEGVKNPSFEIQLIAFGLKALIVMFGWSEEKELEELEEKLKRMKNVNSVQIIDIRRAIG